MNRVKELRERKGISQRALADAIGVNHTTVLRIETGERKVSSSQALKLAEFFECSIDYLLNVSTRHPSNRLRELRMKKGLTLRGLSQKTGIDFSTLAFCERGQRNFSMNSLSTLADFFGVSTDYLLGRACEDDYTEPSITDEEVKKKYFKTTPKPIRSFRSLLIRAYKPFRSAKNNSQMRDYALGFLQEFALIYDNLKTVTMHIVQPRINNVSSETLTVEELLEWAEKELKPKAQVAYNNTREYAAGKHCKFCKAKAVCKARANSILGRIADILIPF